MVEIVNDVYDFYFFYSHTLLPLKNRLKKKKDFQKVFQRGKGIKEKFLTLRWSINNLKISRFGIVISQKVSKKAVLRNKLRRILKEKIKLNLPHLKEGIDVIIIVNPGAAKEKKEKIVENLSKIFLRSKLIKNEKTNY